ncbi:orc1/cdc6 family replication initiation protein [Halalkalirubrum salinum]|uniref:orc1/cdc6 family replication initiation protein n=1 Tax=Halalkalirubrum salinum TaxID=2563889 RepID=UPI0010FB7618|nr:orc1/cdc6 family replication initiation protein [Halalkalirubrum salinum]
MPIFERDQTIFEDEDILREDYQPKRLTERDDELDAFKAYLQPVINGKQPRNIFLYGKTGVGKTAATRYLLDHLERDAEQYEDLSITTIYCNCEDLTSSYQVAIELTNQLRTKNNQLSSTGYPLNEVYNKLYSELEALGGTILVVLDEVDQIGDDDSILYQLPRARANGYLKDAKIGIVGISNDFKFRENLDPRVEDTLCEREIHFPPYDATDLQAILERRSALAFRDDVLDSEVVPLCAAFAAQDRGSARQALDLLFEAGDLARRNDRERVTEADVRRGQQLLEKRQIEQSLLDLTVHGHLTLFTMAVLTVEGAVPAQKLDIYTRYERFARELDREPLSDRSVHSHLNELVMLGVLDRREHNRGRAGGIFYEYTLAVCVDTVFSALGDVQAFDGIDLETLRDRCLRKRQND